MQRHIVGVVDMYGKVKKLVCVQDSTRVFKSRSQQGSLNPGLNKVLYIRQFLLYEMS